mmetsp:Transcript_72699/g.151861  ORF Transcript_72699/g.151861 Transcript_72699/m.151861 type:complete len:315 (-) Transcript_72699:343-1287(-)|eukprot:CAMPEP_0181297946 /NCGR_PEP_ID=MMETSP1101-20121128/5518_1 /TAXON_ID=46948 /ORGANISM="Rhodomonas abbreviata, Strain Caron Lab Isolate" /LENGTH=314 /DNA_ID=CAMNT_0023402931 /DNA_START=146 /DNA_END=1090 /DNA_ORIENTATION=-
MSAEEVANETVQEEVPAASKAFDLDKQKANAMQNLPARGRESPCFKNFYKSQLCDDFLCAALDHFAALLRVEDMMNARVAGKKPQDIPPPSAEEKQAASLLEQTVKEVSTFYCYTIMQFSRYKAAQQDRMFFESLYEFITAVVCAAFPTQHRFRIEDEVSRIVRSDTFNLTKRKNDSNHHTKMYFTSRELYVLRYAGDGFMGRKILAALHPRRHAGDSVNTAIQRRSPLAAMLVPSPAEIAQQAARHKQAAAASASPKLRSPKHTKELPLPDRSDRERAERERKARSVSPSNLRAALTLPDLKPPRRKTPFETS